MGAEAGAHRVEVGALTVEVDVVELDGGELDVELDGGELDGGELDGGELDGGGVADRGPGRPQLRLRVDGVAVAMAPAALGLVRLRAGSLVVTARCPWPGRVLDCTLEGPRPLPAPDPVAGPGRPGRLGVDRPGRHRLHPPAGSRRSRLEAWQQAHPALHASRHVLLALVQILASVVGLGVVLRGLLPRIGWGWLPDLDVPVGWARALGRALGRMFGWLPDPFGWLARLLPDLPDLPALPSWVRAVRDSWPWWGPVLLALAASRRELRQRRARRAEAAADPAEPTKAAGGVGGSAAVAGDRSEVADGAHG